MKVFISWSGKRSKALAALLKEWLPKVIHRCKPWFSAQDIPSGSTWAEEITKNLRNASYGIICLTPENLRSPWLFYEAGALTTKMGKKRAVCPLLLGMNDSELQGPLSLYQARNAVDQDGIFDLIKAINQSDGEAVPDENLKDTFSKNWDEFAGEVAKIEKIKIPPEPAVEQKVVPDILFDCTKEEFINHLSACNEVTILGITNGSLPGCLDDAWEKRKKSIGKPWKKVEIIFPAQHLLKDMPFPGINDGPNTLTTLNHRWEKGVERARQFLRSYSNPDKPVEKRAHYVEIRSYDKPFPFVGQLYDNSKVRVAYILPDKDIRASCYMNLQVSKSPCKSLHGKIYPVLESPDAPPCKKIDGASADCDECGWRSEHSPCSAIFDAFKKISNASTPLLAANIIGEVRNRENPHDMRFEFSSLRPQNNWREPINTAAPRPVHLLSFILMQYENNLCLLLRNEKNSSGEFDRYGVLPGKVNDVDFFDKLPDDAYRNKVYEMQRAWDTREADGNMAVFAVKAQEASASFAEKIGLNLNKSLLISKKLLNDACTRAAVRSIYERLGLAIEPSRLTLLSKTFLVQQGSYELFIRCFVLKLKRTELDLIANPSFSVKCTEEIRALKRAGELTDFLNTYTEDILALLSPGAGKKK
jgi:hypothetical protein